MFRPLNRQNSTVGHSFPSTFPPQQEEWEGGRSLELQLRWVSLALEKSDIRKSGGVLETLFLPHRLARPHRVKSHKRLAPP